MWTRPAWMIVIFILLAVVIFVGLRLRSRTTEIPSAQELGSPPPTSHALSDVASKLLLNHIYDTGPPTFYFPETMSGGVAIFDANNDGRMDALFRGAAAGRGHKHYAKVQTSRLLLQQNDGTFKDESKTCGIDDDSYGQGVAIADINNDGLNDVFLTNINGDKLYLNLGDAKFVDITNKAGVINSAMASSACFFDYDRDGRVDLFVCNYTADPTKDDCQLPSGRKDYCHPRVYEGLSDRLFRNVTPAGGDQTLVKFEDVSDDAGISKFQCRGLGVLPMDVNDDGYPDLFVANDVHPNHLWVNQKNGKFEQLADVMGCAVDASGRLQGCMGVDEADVNGDGLLDLVVTNFYGEYTTLYLRRAYGFKDSSGVWNTPTLTRTFTGFGTAFIDLDCDGVDELLQVNGGVTQNESNPPKVPPKDPSDRAGTVSFWDAYRQPTMAMRNTGNRFEDITKDTMDFGSRKGIGRGLALGDLDGDGRVEIVVTWLAEPAAVYQIASRGNNHWVSFRAVDPKLGSRDALGAEIRIRAGDKRIVRRLRTAGSYVTSHQPIVSFGLGERRSVDELEVLWPDGDRTAERFSCKVVDGIQVLRRGEGTK